MAAARPPVTPVAISVNGAYDAVRSSPAQGSCGIHGYPCRHPGVDLLAAKGTPVVAPHDGWVLVSKATDKAPFAGYGPSVVLIAHDDSTSTWGEDLLRSVTPGLKGPRRALRYSLLAHLQPTSLTFDTGLAPGAMAAASYDILDDGTNVPTWALVKAPDTYVRAGEVVGYVGAAKHVHWEVRKQPFGTHRDGATIDPFQWLAHYDDGLTPWGAVELPVDATRAKRPGGGGRNVAILLALLAAWAMRKELR